MDNKSTSWINYMMIAAEHSKGNAQHWFRYIRKYIDKCGEVFTMDDVNALYKCEILSPFQRISLRAAFTEGSPTRQHIISLNQPVESNILSELRTKYDNHNS